MVISHDLPVLQNKANSGPTRPADRSRGPLCLGASVFLIIMPAAVPRCGRPGMELTDR
jgi:hypothetical protein